MDENGVTQVLTPEDPLEQADSSGAAGPPEGPPDAPAAAAAGGLVPKKWFAAAVIAVLLIAAGAGVYLGTRDSEEPEGDSTEVAEVAEGEADSVIVPDLRGMTLERATADVEAAGLVLGVTATAVVDPSVTPAGTVLSQDPLPGTEAEPGAEIALVIAEAPAATEQPPASGTSGTTQPSAGSTPAEPPPAPPADVTVNDISKLIAKPKVIDLSLIQTTQWTTVVEHTGTALEWTSGPATFGSGSKRIILNADGPNGNLVAVYSWDSATSTDWKLQTIVVSQPGDLPYQSIFDVPASTQTFMVRSNSTAVLWKLTVQEQK